MNSYYLHCVRLCSVANKKLYVYPLTISFDIIVCSFSVALSRLAARKYARIIQKLGFPVSA